MVARHNGVARSLHWYLCREYGFNTYHYSQDPVEVLENERALLYWDHPVPMGKPLRHKRPDIVLVDKLEKRVFIIEVRVSWPTSIEREEQRKYIKYAVNSNLPEEFDITQQVPYGDNLQNELMLHYGFPTLTIPIVLGVHGEVSSLLFSRLTQSLGIPSKDAEDLIDRMARSAAIGTHRIIKAHMAHPV